MKAEDPELFDLRQFRELNAVAPHTTGTVDDDDDPADESPDENEASIRETSEATEAPEEFEVDDEDEHPEGDGDGDDDDGDEDDA
jgi:hypothetical protein